MTRGYARKLNRVREGFVVVQKAWPIEEMVLSAGLQRLVHLYGHFMTILATLGSFNHSKAPGRSLRFAVQEVERRGQNSNSVCDLHSASDVAVFHLSSRGEAGAVAVGQALAGCVQLEVLKMDLNENGIGAGPGLRESSWQALNSHWQSYHA